MSVAVNALYTVFYNLLLSDTNVCIKLFYMNMCLLKVWYIRYYLAWSYENQLNRHFIISLNFFGLSLFTVKLFAYVSSFLGCFVSRNLCRSGCWQNFANFYLFPTKNSVFLAKVVLKLLTRHFFTAFHSRKKFLGWNDTGFGNFTESDYWTNVLKFASF